VPDFPYSLQGVQFSGSATGSGKPILWAAGILGHDFLHRFWRVQFSGTTSGGNPVCWLVPSVTHGAAGVMNPAYTGAPDSLVFQGEGSRSCSGGSIELCVPMCIEKQVLLPSEH
jgi:hypothetical protein